MVYNILSLICRKSVYGVYSFLFELSLPQKFLIIMAGISACSAAYLASLCLAPFLMIWSVFIAYHYLVLRPLLYIAIGRNPLLIAPDFFQFLINSFRDIFSARTFFISILKAGVFVLDLVFLKPCNHFLVLVGLCQQSWRNDFFKQVLIALQGFSIGLYSHILGLLLSEPSTYFIYCALAISANLFIFVCQPETFWDNVRLLDESRRSSLISLIFTIARINITLLAVSIPSLLFMSFIDKKHLTESESICIDNLLKSPALFLENALSVIAELGYSYGNYRNTILSTAECFLSFSNLNTQDILIYLQLLTDLMDNQHKDFESPGLWFISQVCFINTNLSNSQSQFMRQLFAVFIESDTQEHSEPGSEPIDREIAELPEYNSAFIQQNQLVVLSQRSQNRRQNSSHRSYCCIS